MRIAALLLAGAISCAAQKFAVDGLAGVNIRVSHLQDSLRFYRDLLGFPVAFELEDSVFLQINRSQYIELTPDLPPNEDKRMGEIRFQAANLDDLPHLPLATPSVLCKDQTRAIHFVSPDEQALAFVLFTPQSLEMQKKVLPALRISNRLWHAGIVVPRKDLDQALAFYGHQLGFQEFWRGGPEGAQTAWINMRTQGQRGDYVELMLSDGQPDRKRLGSMQHICLQVPNIQSALATVQQRDSAKTQTQKPRVGRNKKWQLNLFDPDGTRVELMEPNEAVLAVGAHD